jgi:adenylate kinase family enzyme
VAAASPRSAAPSASGSASRCTRSTRCNFKPNWSRTPLDEVERTLDTWIAEDAWIVDGFGPWPAIERRFDAADTIIWIDFPLHVHLRWTAKRQLFWQTTAGGRRRPPTILMFRTILRVHRKLRPLLAASLASRAPKVVRLRSPRELRAFLEDARAER